MSMYYSDHYPSILHANRRQEVAKQIYSIVATLFGKEVRGKHVLDIGTSAGFIASHFAKQGNHVVGIDVDRHAIAFAKKKFQKPHLSFRVMDATNMTFPSQSFDVVICNHVCVFIKDAEALFDEIYRVLTPGGMCYFASWSKINIWENHYRLPFLPMLPRGVSSLLVRLLRNQSYDLYYRSYWELLDLTKRFRVHTMTGAIVKKKIGFRLPEPLLPTFIWILEKIR